MLVFFQFGFFENLVFEVFPPVFSPCVQFQPFLLGAAGTDATVGAQSRHLVETVVPVGVELHIHGPVPFAAVLGVVAGMVNIFLVEQVARHQDARVAGEE